MTVRPAFSSIAASLFFYVAGSLVAVSLLLYVAGCTRASAASDPAPSGPPPIHVETTAVTLQTVPTYLPLTGELKSGRETDLAANANGRVMLTKVERGSKVAAGDTLATLDVRSSLLNAAEAKANAAMAGAQAQAAKTECDRAQKLVASGAISSAESDRLEATCKTSASAAVAADTRASLAAQNVGDGVIRAPFAGFVTERYVDVGEYVHPETRIVTLVDLSALRLQIAVPETNIGQASPGVGVLFSVVGYPDRSFHGTIKYVSAAVRTATRDVMAEAVVDDPSAAEILRPGMFASVRVVTGTQNVPVVAARDVVMRDGKPTAFVVVGNRIEERIVQRGDAVALAGGDGVVILRGLAEGDNVVTAPSGDLKNGQNTH
jgi:RND family efflux transporter MFP subunit